MQNSEIKQRKKTLDNKDRRTEHEDWRQKVDKNSSDMKSTMLVMSLCVSVLMMWFLFQQDARLADLREKYDDLYKKSNIILDLEAQMSQVSEKCESVQTLMSSMEKTSPISQLESLDVEVTQLKQIFSSLTGQRQQLQENLTDLIQAVERMENRTAVISSDVVSKVASIRTDVRRMGGLESEVDELLSQTNTLEEKVTQAEKLMVKRIGDLLVSSIDRVSSLKSSTERNAQRLDQIGKFIQELFTANRKLSERILVIESSQAKLLKMTTFAGDLKPKVLTIRQDFAIIEPKLADLTLRIGHLAEDMMKTEGEIAQIKSLANRIAHVDLSQHLEDFTETKRETLDQYDQLTP
ncbi:inhibitor of nuclear factor kappa-B kinase-interacting protein isoform X3 [Myxocyprinus asiaticus]|uniref:inhibitor of nuclear factor kappa-B kinase-interacting protein isoform X3 n=1 Tax=Myxocyprinus asiaticus TaxID=70543 RepID=UPI0022233569|nr:inhibitor of nuclear factor kappa-B kinase-interacting protein isoform X3 [Myxocyprinus asiaticus]